jgi:hypothetical protein
MSQDPKVAAAPKTQNEILSLPVSEISEIAKLILKRKVFGKLRVSISPVQDLKDRRRLLPVVWKDIQTEHLGKLAGEACQCNHCREKTQRGALDSRSKSQERSDGDCFEDILPPHHVFTRYGAEVIQESLWIAKHRYDNQGIFLTGTLPSESGVAKWLVCDKSGWILNRITQRFRDLFEQEYTCVFVWEMTKRGKPHCHVALLSNEHEALLRILWQWHELWFSVLRDLTRETGVNLFERSVLSDGERSLMSWYPLGPVCQADAQVVDKDIARYIAKYISKNERQQSSSHKLCPRRWWSVDSKTRQEAKQERLRVVIGGLSLDNLKFAAEALRVQADELKLKIFDFLNPVFKRFGGFVALSDNELDLSVLSAWTKWLTGQRISFSLHPG